MMDASFPSFVAIGPEEVSLGQPAAGGADLADSNHHLWRNHGIWFVAYVSYPTPVTKERVRHSLKTRNVEIARVRRDEVLERARAQGLLTKPPIPEPSRPPRPTGAG